MTTPDLFSSLENPESQGLDSAALAGVLDRIRTEGIQIDSVLVARHGRVVLDAYRFPFRPGMRHDMASVTKSITALVVGAALADRDAFGMNEPVRPDGTTIGDLLSMTAGLGPEPGATDTDCIKAMTATADWVQHVEQLPRLWSPGTRFSYFSPGYLLVAAHILKVTGASLESNAARLLFEPLGITDWYWRTDALGRTNGWGDLGLHPRDSARIGQMILEGGRFGGRQVLPEAWVAAATAERLKTGLRDEGYGYGFWRPPGHTDLIALQGRGGQQVILSPTLNLMMVVTGTGYPEVTAFSLLEPVVASATLAPRAVGDGRQLDEAVQRLAAPPVGEPPDRAGPHAAALLGRKLRVEGRNQLGLRNLSITQAGPEGRFQADLMGQAIASPVGFDAVRRVADDGMRGSGMSGLGQWQAPDRLRLEITSYGFAMRFIFDLRFRPDRRVDLRLAEGTGYFAFETTAAPA